MLQVRAAYGLLGLGVSLVLFGAIALLGAIFGFGIYEICSAPEAGQPNRIERYLGGIKLSIKFTLGRIVFHLHHWLVMLLLFVLLWSFEDQLLLHFSSNTLHLMYGCCFGGTAQGLRYRDRAQIVWLLNRVEELEEEIAAACQHCLETHCKKTEKCLTLSEDEERTEDAADELI